MMNVNIHFSLDVGPEQIEAIVAGRVLGRTIKPELVTADELRAPQDYKRLQRLEEKQQCSRALLDGLKVAWVGARGAERAAVLCERFIALSAQLETDGAVIFGDIIDRVHFAALVAAYDRMIEEKGNKSLLHSFLNLRNHPDFLANGDFNGAFVQPLLIALMAYRIGGAMRVVDARAKDTEPLTVRAQDNMLHIDNTPFNDEYKILVTWLRGQATGPQGQNFVFMPGTHRGFRNSLVGEDGHAWSVENASIFVADETVEQLFAFQRKLRGANSVIEVQSNRPTSTLFAAGSLVHHRYRTKEGQKRSCLIIAFHPVFDNPGEYVGGITQAEGTRDLDNLLFGYQGPETAAIFVQALIARASEIAEKIDDIGASNPVATVVIQPDEKMMDEAQLRQWRALATYAPTIEELKTNEQSFPLGVLPRDDLISVLGDQLMFYDKHGPLDLILYYDSHEELRKWARNRIREMHRTDLRGRLLTWADAIRQPSLEDMLTPQQIQAMTAEMIAGIHALSPEQRAQGRLDPYERISPIDAYRSLAQLLTDLAEAIGRCDSLQNFLSTSLFVFWVADELKRLNGGNDERLQSIGGRALRSYIATAIVEKLRQDGLRAGSPER
jgi:hypothetical protein